MRILIAVWVGLAPGGYSQEARKDVEEFKARFKEAPAPCEKAHVVLAFGGIDDVRIHGICRDGSGALPLADLLRIQAR